MAAFGKVKQKVIGELWVDNHNNIPPNVRFSEFVPQNDLLGDPKTRLLVTHGGNDGQMEALYHGVPMVTIPVAGDALYNAERSEFRGYGKTVFYWSLTTDALFSAIDETINNPVYKDNIMQCQQKLQDMPTTKERLVFWIDHVNKFGGQHLKPPYMKISLWKFLGLDIFLCLGACLIMSFYLSKMLVSNLVAFLVKTLKTSYGSLRVKGKKE